MSVSKIQEESTENLGINNQFLNRKDRRISLPGAIQADSKRRRGTIHHTGHGLLDQLKTAHSPWDILHASKTIKAYRQRRASHLKHLRGKKTEFQENIPLQNPIERFRKAVRLVVILRHAFQNIVFYATQKGRHEQITSETTLTLKATVAKGTVEDLLFDPEDYKCHYKDRFPSWAKEVTEKAPHLRTDQEVKLLGRLLKQLKGFRRYSPDVQISICRAIKYDQYDRRRVIIRKGHIAQRFYFIYSGSVCVTDDEDEESAFVKPETEQTSLKRGDFFGELAFLKNVPRAATIVCLEKTEFLSVNKEDFFATGIDKCFTHDINKRVEFLSQHPLFVTWPKTAVHHVAEVSRVHEYHSDEVIVKNSFSSSWLYFILKGQCDILRLVDLRNCSAFQKYSPKTRRSSVPGHSTMYSSNNSITPESLLMFKTFPIMEENEDEEEEDSPAVFSSYSDINIHKKHNIHENTSRIKSAVTKKSRSWQENAVEHSRGQKHDLQRNLTLKHAENKDSKAKDVGLGVYMAVERLNPGEYFGAWSIINEEDLKVRSKTVIDERRFSLLSRGCELIKMPKNHFHRRADYETIEQLRELTSTFPCDNELCQTFMKLNDWRSYREELVENLVEKKVKEHEMSVGLWRTQRARSSPVPSPLCSFRPQHPVVANKWEYFRGSGWIANKAISPLVKAGQRPKTRRKSYSGMSSTPHSSRHQTRPSRPGSFTSYTNSRYPLNTEPLVGNKIVVAQGSHRALVLTHGGIRCNDLLS